MSDPTDFLALDCDCEVCGRTRPAHSSADHAFRAPSDEDDPR